jgi:hypothetical protein
VPSRQQSREPESACHFGSVVGPVQQDVSEACASVVGSDDEFVEVEGRCLDLVFGPECGVDLMFRGFDREMERYANIVRHEGNPVERLRLVTNTEAAAGFLGERARRIIGDDIDLDVQVRTEGDN